MDAEVDTGRDEGDREDGESRGGGAATLRDSAAAWRVRGHAVLEKRTAGIYLSDEEGCWGWKNEHTFFVFWGKG